MALEIISMDLSSTIIGSAVSVIVVIISYVVYKIGIGEKSFEEVIEEQKRRSIEEELKHKSERVKKEKKFKKTWGKKSKEKSEPESAEPTEARDSIPEIEIIEPKEIKPMKQKNKASKSGLNLQIADVLEKSKKVEHSPAAEKPAQEKKKTTTPDVERTKAEAKVIETPSKQVEIKETVQPSPVAAAPGSQTSAVSKKKKKESPVEKDAVPMTASKLLSVIQESELEAEEIQNLIDVLLNKQKDSSSWTKKNDPLALTKKNLQEKEQMLDLERRQSQDVMSKLKNLREEHNSLKTKFTTQEKSAQEKVARLQQEIQNLTARTKQVQDQLLAEKEKTAQLEKEHENKLLTTVKNLEEEKAILQQKITKFETESRSGISKSEYDAVEKSREDLQKDHALLVEQHTQVVLKEKTQSVQLSDAKLQIDKLSSLNKSLSDDCKALKDSVELAKKGIEEKLKAEEKRSSELETQLKQLSTQAADVAPLMKELKDLKSENERLVGQLVSTKERVAGDGQEVVHQNGELNGKPQVVSEKLQEEKDKVLQEKECLLVQLNEELSKQKAKMTVLSEEIENQKQKNNELREKNWKAMEALANAEKNADQRLKEIQSAADQKVVQLEKDVAAANQQLSNSKNDTPSLELSERLAKAEDELAQKLSDYNKELEKNRQLTTRIAEVQRSLDETNENFAKSQLQTKECLQRICPAVSIDKSLSFEKWLSSFEEQAIQCAQSTSFSAEELEKREKEYQEKQTHYEQVLAETETTLLQLQKSAESQEILWKERLKNKEEELEKIKSERDALVNEKEAMQSTFQQISQLEELQEKLKLLQSTLESAESDRSHLEQKYDEVHNNCLNLRDQLENKEKQILELQKDFSSLDSLNKEIEDLKSKLEKEKKINKDFSSQMVRLNSLVKIGQDALKAEQEMVKKLKAQLDGAQVSTANGTASATKTSPVTVKESQPKTKSAEKSKKRMDASDKK